MVRASGNPWKQEKGAKETDTSLQTGEKTVVALVERDDLLAKLESLLARCRTERGGVVLLEGVSGVGRTQLLLTLGDRARRAGFQLLSAACSPEERSLPLGMVAQLMRSVALPNEVAAEIDRLLSTGTSAAGPDAAAPVQVFHGLSTALADMAADTPVLIGVDDVGYADTPSLQYLLHLSRRVATTRIMLVLTDTIDRRTPHLPFRAELLRQPHARRMQLNALSPHGVQQLLAQRLDPTDAARVAPSYASISGGNPQLLQALVDDHVDFGEPSPSGYGLVLLACLRRGDPTFLSVARGLAVLGRSAAPEEVARLVDADPDAVAQATAAMNDGGLLTGGWFHHQAGRLAVLDHIAPTERAELRQRAARLLYDSGAPALDAARQLIAADRPAQAWAAPMLQEAADQAMLDHSPELAAKCLQLALRAPVDERRRAAVRAQLTQCESAVNPAVAAQQLTSLIGAARSGLLARADQLWLVKALLWHGRTSDAVDLLDRLRDADHEPQEDLRDLELWLAGCYPPLARRRPAGPPAHRPGIATALGVDPWLHCAATLADHMARGRAETAVEHAEQTLRNLLLRGSTPWAEESATLALYTLIYADWCDLAREWCDRLEDKLDVERMPTAHALVSAARAEAAVRQGDLAAAMRHAETASTRIRSKSWGVAIGLPLGSLVLAATRSGDYERAARHLSLETPEAIFLSRYGLPYLHARGQYHLATDQHHAALADFLACGELMRAWDMDVAGIVPWRAGAAEAWQLLGNPEQARSLVLDQLSRQGTGSARARAASLRALAAATPPGKRLPLLNEALDIFELYGDRFEQARVLADLSRAYNALDQKRRARMLFRQALHVADMCGAEPLHRDLLSLAGEVATATPTPDEARGIESLTGSERRVASLAVMGYTNREIASKLYITASTVEQHLTRVYRKLNVKRRKELPVVLWAKTARTQRASRTGSVR
ncbi:AAA family ATPase [Dactylosporangium sp. NPDC048998]|uniref:helix-turn-helix transcriptional regulator n=1 Tax=Dactylosporangium sp. NPDC048998 TaxID=3363976 RepID=UPI00371C65CA